MPCPSHPVKIAALQEALDRGFLVASAPGERILVPTLATDLNTLGREFARRYPVYCHTRTGYHADWRSGQANLKWYVFVLDLLRDRGYDRSRYLTH